MKFRFLLIALFASLSLFAQRPGNTGGGNNEDKNAIVSPCGDKARYTLQNIRRDAQGNTRYDTVYFYRETFPADSATAIDFARNNGLVNVTYYANPPEAGMIRVSGTRIKNGSVSTHWVFPCDIGLGTATLTEADLNFIAGQVTTYQTQVFQDSILIYTSGGKETGRDTIRVTSSGGGGGGIAYAAGDNITIDGTTINGEVGQAEIDAARIQAENAANAFTSVQVDGVQQMVRDTAAAIRADFPQGGVGLTEAEAAAIAGDTADVVRDEINIVKEQIPAPLLNDISSDGFGSSLNAPNLNNLNFTASPLNSSGNLQGEVSLGIVAAGPYVFTVPQDADEISRVNTTTGKIDKIPAVYPRQTDPSIFRDKFNGGVFDGNYIWITPSWAEFALKIHPDTLQVSKTFLVNNYGDDAYNGAIYAGNAGRVFFVPHDSPVIKWIDVKTETIGQNDLSGISDISLGNRSFLSGCFSGESVFLYPRSADKIIEIDPFTGNVIGEYTHPLAGTPEGAAGYFHGGTFDGRFIYLNPWGAQEIVKFDTKLKEYSSQPHNLPGSAPYSLSSVNINGFIYFTSRNQNSAAVLNTYTGLVSMVSSNLPANESGAIVYKNGKIWLASATSDNVYSAKVNTDNFSAVRVTAGQIDIGGKLNDVNGNEGENGQILSYSPIGPVWSTPQNSGIGDSINLRVLNVANLNAVGADQEAPYFEYQSYGNTVQINDTTPSNGNGFLFQNTDKISDAEIYSPVTGGAVFFEISGTPSGWNNGRVFSNVSGPTSTNGLQIFMADDRLAVRGSGGISVMPTGNIPAGVRRVAIRFNTNSITMYVDGVQVFTEAKGFAYSFVPSSPTTFGNLPDGSRPLNAELREMVIYDTDPGAAEAISYTNATTGQDYPGAVYLLDLTSPATFANGTVSLKSVITDVEGNTGQDGQYLQSNLDGKVIWSDPIVFDGNFGGQKGTNLAEGTNITDAATYGQLLTATGGVVQSEQSAGVFTTDASGDITIPHTLPSVPGVILLTLGMPDAYRLSYHTVNGSNFKVRVTDSNGAPVLNNSTIVLSWIAYQ